MNGVNKILRTRASGGWTELPRGGKKKSWRFLPDGCAWAAVVAAHGSSPGFK